MCLSCFIRNKGDSSRFMKHRIVETGTCAIMRQNNNIHSPARSRTALVIAIACVFSSLQCFAQSGSPMPSRFGIEGGAYFSGDDLTSAAKDYKVMPTCSSFIEFPVYGRFGLNIAFMLGSSWNKAEDLSERKLVNLTFKDLSYNTLYGGGVVSAFYAIPRVLGPLTSSVSVRGGVLSKRTQVYRDQSFYPGQWAPYVIYGVGLSVDYPLFHGMDARVSYSGFLSTSDNIDGLKLGNSRDGFSTFSIGVSWRAEESLPTMPSMPTPFARIGKNGKPASIDPISAVLQLKEFRSLDDLKTDPDLAVLYIRRNLRGFSDADAEFELRRNGKKIAQSTKEIPLEEISSIFHPEDFIDFEHLDIAEGFQEKLPTGTYEVNVTVRPRGPQRSSTVSGGFSFVDMDSYFGTGKTLVENLIQSGDANVEPGRKNGVVIRLFEPQGPKAQDEKRNPTYEGVGPSSAEGTYATARADLVEAASIFPTSTPRESRESLLDEKTSRAFNNAISVLSSMQRKKRASAVIAVIYFPYVGSLLSDEGKLTLDNVARMFRLHPNIHMELRGFAGDYSDEAYNQRLSEQRTERVFDYLARKIVPTSVIRSTIRGSADLTDFGDSVQHQLYRKVEISLIPEDTYADYDTTVGESYGAVPVEDQ